MVWVTWLPAQQRSELFSGMATQKGTMPGVVEKDSGQGDLNKHEDPGRRYSWVGL